MVDTAERAGGVTATQLQPNGAGMTGIGGV
jgi:hypothetical protein